MLLHEAGDGGSKSSNVPIIRHSRIVIHDINIPENKKASSVPETGGWCLCFLSHSAIIRRTGLGGEKRQIKSFRSIRFHLASRKMITTF
jgi:hypothetical protein